MLDELEKFLLSDPERKVDPEHLTMLGKQAAANYLNGGKPLTDSVRFLSKEASLNEEQTKRVIEQANVSTFIQLFKDDYDKNIDFELADYGAISSTQDPAEVEKVSHYSKPTTYRYVPGQEYVSLENVFGSNTSLEKTAEPGWTAQDMHEYFDMRYRAKHSASELSDLAEIFEGQVTKLALAMGQEIKEGIHPLDVVLLVKEAGIDENLMAVLLEKISAPPEKTKALDNQPGLVGKQKTELPDKVQAAILRKKLLKKKVASAREANTDHPIYKKASILATLTNKILLVRDEIGGLVKKAEDLKRPQDIKELVGEVL